MPDHFHLGVTSRADSGDGGHLTILDLEDMNLMPSLRKGTAHFFTETLHVSGGAVVPTHVQPHGRLLR